MSIFSQVIGQLKHAVDVAEADLKDVFSGQINQAEVLKITAQLQAGAAVAQQDVANLGKWLSVEIPVAITDTQFILGFLETIGAATKPELTPIFEALQLGLKALQAAYDKMQAGGS